jgi:hypothetical protein
MILVDTSVLIEYLRDKEGVGAKIFHEIFQMNLPFGINYFIYQELLQGCRTDKDYRLLKEYLDSQTFYDFKKGRESYADAARIYFDLRQHGVTVRSTIDCLIAQMAIENDLYLLHHDEDFDRIAGYFPLKIWRGKTID